MIGGFMNVPNNDAVFPPQGSAPRVYLVRAARATSEACRTGWRGSASIAAAR